MSSGTRKRWFQFSLSALFWLTLAVALLLWGLSERSAQQRHAAENARQAAQTKRTEAELAKMRVKLDSVTKDAAWTKSRLMERDLERKLGDEEPKARDEKPKARARLLEPYTSPE